mmetsp:Transcript_4403/g.10780  ORF Transcript_4403/g.10780 Transcript_4403/m.10780 type:complete len:214 (-) Transcript_4403:215-856(-)
MLVFEGVVWNRLSAGANRVYPGAVYCVPALYVAVLLYPVYRCPQVLAALDQREEVVHDPWALFVKELEADRLLLFVFAAKLERNLAVPPVLREIRLLRLVTESLVHEHGGMILILEPFLCPLEKALHVAEVERLLLVGDGVNECIRWLGHEERPAKLVRDLLQSHLVLRLEVALDRRLHVRPRSRQELRSSAKLLEVGSLPFTHHLQVVLDGF